jgi:hypothetical protein
LRNEPAIVEGWIVLRLRRILVLSLGFVTRILGGLARFLDDPPGIEMQGVEYIFHKFDA